MKRSCLALLALLALAARQPVLPDGSWPRGDAQAHGGTVGLELRQLPGAPATADYVLRGGARPAGQWPAGNTAVTHGARYVF